MVTHAHLADGLIDDMLSFAVRSPRVPFSIFAKKLPVLLGTLDLLHWDTHNDHVALAFTLRCLGIEEYEFSVAHDGATHPQISLSEVFDVNLPLVGRCLGV